MPTRPDIKVLTNTSVEVLNVIRNNASQDYKNYVPVATPNAEVIKSIGSVLMDFPALQNEFISALINRIGRVIVTSKLYENPWNIFKRGLMDMGETVEEVFVNLAKPHQFSPEVAEETVFKREIADVRSSFHIMNYQKFYKTTISQEQLRQAFLSINGVTDLIMKITESLYTGANYDEFLVMRYLIAQRILNNGFHYISVSDTTPDNIKNATAEIRKISSDLTFMSPKFNVAGVQTFTPRESQYIIMTTEFEANMDVNVLASAFNLPYADFLGHKITTPNFGDLDIARLNMLFKDDKNYVEYSQDTLDLLDKVSFIIVDREWFMILDNLIKFTENYNGEGMYWNYWLHTWKTFSTSPFANAICGVNKVLNNDYRNIDDYDVIDNCNGVNIGVISDFNDENPLFNGNYLLSLITGETVFPPTIKLNVTSDSEYVTISNGNNVIVNAPTTTPTPVKLTAHNPDDTISTITIHIAKRA